MADAVIKMPPAWPDGTKRSMGTAFDAAYLVRRGGVARPAAPVRVPRDPTRPREMGDHPARALDARGRRVVGLEKRA